MVSRVTSTPVKFPWDKRPHLLVYAGCHFAYPSLPCNNESIDNLLPWSLQIRFSLFVKICYAKIYLAARLVYP